MEQDGGDMKFGLLSGAAGRRGRRRAGVQAPRVAEGEEQGWWRAALGQRAAGLLLDLELYVWGVALTRRAREGAGAGAVGPLACASSGPSPVAVGLPAVHQWVGSICRSIAFCWSLSWRGKSTSNLQHACVRSEVRRGACRESAASASAASAPIMRQVCNEEAAHSATPPSCSPNAQVAALPGVLGHRHALPWHHLLLLRRHRLLRQAGQAEQEGAQRAARSVAARWPALNASDQRAACLNPRAACGAHIDGHGQRPPIQRLQLHHRAAQRVCQREPARGGRGEGPRRMGGKAAAECWD